MYQQLTVATAEILTKNESIVFGTCPPNVTALDKPIMPRYFGNGSTLEVDVISYTEVVTQPRKSDNKQFFIRNIICALKKDATLKQRQTNAKSGIEYFDETILSTGATIQVTITGANEDAIKSGVKKIVGTSVSITTVNEVSISLFFE